MNGASLPATSLAVARVFSASPQDLTQAVAGERFDAVVFDHYGLSASDHQAMAKGRPGLVIDRGGGVRDGRG